MNVLITGCEGIVGTVLKEQLEPEQFTITPFSLSQDHSPHDRDARDYADLVKAAEGVGAIIHLAWDTEKENFLSGRISLNNSLMIENVFRAAVETGVKRVILASSVHADDFVDRQDVTSEFEADALPWPDSPYGATKVYMEAMGRYHARKKGLEVASLRLGCVDPDDIPTAEPYSERLLWLSHRDAGKLFTAYLLAESIPGRYEAMYGVSDNMGRLHSIKNSVGWVPLDGLKPEDYHKLKGRNQYL